MDKPRPEGTTLVIMVSPVPGKYEAFTIMFDTRQFFLSLNHLLLMNRISFKNEKKSA